MIHLMNKNSAGRYIFLKRYQNVSHIHSIDYIMQIILWLAKLLPLYLKKKIEQ